MLPSGTSIQEDFTIMVERSHRRYYLHAGAVLIAGALEQHSLPRRDHELTFRSHLKLGKARRKDGHAPRGHPHLVPLAADMTAPFPPSLDKTKRPMSKDRFFLRMPLDKPVVRNNYAFQVVQEGHTH